MIGFLIRRVMQTIVVTLIVTIITFLLLHLVPGGEVRAILGIRASQAEVAGRSKAWGFDQPLYVQYLKWIWQLCTGTSVSTSSTTRRCDLLCPALSRSWYSRSSAPAWAC